MSCFLQPGERLTDLYHGGLKLIQQPKYFSMAIDPILLADFAHPGPKEQVVDLGTGNGAIPLLIWARSPQSEIVALEIMENNVDLARRNVAYNQLEGSIQIVQGDICQASEILGKAKYSLVVSNPPYAQMGRGKISPVPEVAAAKTEIYCTMADVIREAALLLNSQGRFCMVHRCARLAEAFSLLEANKLVAKGLRLVQSEAGTDPILFLIEAVKNGKPGMGVLPTLVLQKQGKYLPEIRRIFGDVAGGADGGSQG